MLNISIEKRRLSYYGLRYIGTMWDTRRLVISLEPNHDPIDVERASRVKLPTLQEGTNTTFLEHSDDRPLRRVLM